MTHTTISRNQEGTPPTRRSRQATAVEVPKHLEATVVLIDGRSSVEHVERNDADGHRAMDRWAFERNTDPKVDYIAVQPTGRIAGYERSR